MLFPLNYKLILKTTDINLIKSDITVTAKLSITVDIKVTSRSTCSCVWFYYLFEKMLTLFSKIRPISDELRIKLSLFVSFSLSKMFFHGCQKFCSIITFEFLIDYMIVNRQQQRRFWIHEITHTNTLIFTVKIHKTGLIR